MTSTSAVMLFLPQKSSISCVSAIPPMSDLERLRRAKGKDSMRFVRCADDGDVAITTELYILIRMLSLHVARRAVAAHQKLEFTLIIDGGSAADIGRGPPDHLREMTAHFPGGTPTRISDRRVFQRLGWHSRLGWTPRPNHLRSSRSWLGHD